MYLLAALIYKISAVTIFKSHARTVVDFEKLLTIAIQTHRQWFITQSLENKELKSLSVCRIFYWLSLCSTQR